MGACREILSYFSHSLHPFTFLITLNLLCIWAFLLSFFWSRFPFKIIIIIFKKAFPCDNLHNFLGKAWRDFLICFIFFLNCGTLFTWLLVLHFSTASRLLLGFFHFGQLLLWGFCLFICSFLTTYLIFMFCPLLKFQYSSHCHKGSCWRRSCASLQIISEIASYLLFSDASCP